jgi:peptidoglycan/LPS O-acetylase OafA/YrhL
MNATTEIAPKKDLRYHSLDFWRGVACLVVAVYHSIAYITDNPAHVSTNMVSKKIFSLMSQGWAGVPIFFVISGYCIAAACGSGMAKKLPTKTYFFRRFRRIYPPYWILLLAVVGMHLAFQFFSGSDYLADDIVPLAKPWVMSVWQWLGSVTLTEGWRDHFIGDPSRHFVTHAWTLCYEEQFYFVCGMAMLAGRKWFYKIMAGLSAVVFVIAFIHYAVTPLPIEGFFFDGRWLMFAAGVLVFQVLQFGNERSRKRAIYLLGAAACLSVAWRYLQHLQMPREIGVSFIFSICLIVLFKRDRQIAESRILRPVTLCGVMCYSLYLVHWPVVKVTSQWFYRSGLQGEWSTLFISVPISVLISILVAWGFHVVVERRFLNTPPTSPQQPANQKPAPQEVVVPVSA